jgi:L-ascorbate oxidase
LRLVNPMSARFGIPRKDPNVFQVDGQTYDPMRVDRTLRLNHLDEWSLTSYFGSHPFHIHTNPFQIVSITTAKGQLITDFGCPADDDGDPQYCDMIGTWRDTLFVKQGYNIVIRTRYRDYIGDFVLHCHILDHEDQGMMQNVRILP